MIQKIELSIKNSGSAPVRLFIEPLPEVYELESMSQLIVVTELKEEDASACYYIDIENASKWIIYCPGTVFNFSTSYLMQNGMRLKPIPWESIDD